MNVGYSRMAKRAALVLGAYLVMVLLTVAFSEWWRTHLGVEFGWQEILECVYGPAITLESSLLLWLVIWGLLALLTTRHRTGLKPPRAGVAP